METYLITRADLDMFIKAQALLILLPYLLLLVSRLIDGWLSRREWALFCKESGQ